MVVNPAPLTAAGTHKFVVGAFLAAIFGNREGVKVHAAIKPSSTKRDDIIAVTNAGPLAEFISRGIRIVVSPALGIKPFAPLEVNAKNVLAIVEHSQHAHKIAQAFLGH